MGQMSLSDGMSFGVDDYNYFKHMYSGALTGRYYMPLANSKRFGMFTEVRAAGGYGQSESYNVDGDDKYGTYQDIYKFELGLVPGISVFVTNEVAVEVSVGLLGFNYSRTVQTTNQVDKSVMTSSGICSAHNQTKLTISLCSRLEPRAIVEALAEIISSPKVWIKRNGEYKLVEVATTEMEYSLFGEPNFLHLDICLWQKGVTLW